jgi:hypothetical protein
MAKHPNYESFDVRPGDKVTVFRKPSSGELGSSWWTSGEGEGMDRLIGETGTVIESNGSNNKYGPLVKFGILPNECQKGGWYIPYVCLKIVR